MLHYDDGLIMIWKNEYRFKTLDFKLYFCCREKQRYLCATTRLSRDIIIDLEMELDLVEFCNQILLKP